MSENHTALSEREEIEMMLPWYAAGTLDRADTARVEAYIATHPEIGGQLALIREELTETIGSNESMGAPAPGALDRLMAAIEAESGPLSLSAGARESLWQRLSGWIAELSPKPLALAAVVAVAVICVQAVALGVLMSGDTPGQFRTASGDATQPAAEGTYALVGFADTATAGDINALLDGRDAVIVEGPMPGGLYRIRVSASELSAAEREALLSDLRAETGVVAFAAPAD